MEKELSRLTHTSGRLRQYARDGLRMEAEAWPRVWPAASGSVSIDPEWPKHYLASLPMSITGIMARLDRAGNRLQVILTGPMGSGPLLNRMLVEHKCKCT